MKSWRDSGIQEQLEEFCSFQSQSLIRTGWVMSSWRDSQGSSWVFCPKTKAQSELQKKKGQSRTTKDLPEKTFRSSERSFLPENQPIRSHLSGSAQIRSGFNPPTAQMLMKHRRLLLLWVSLHPASLQVVWGRCSPAANCLTDLMLDSAESFQQPRGHGRNTPQSAVRGRRWMKLMCSRASATFPPRPQRAEQSPPVLQLSNVAFDFVLHHWACSPPNVQPVLRLQEGKQQLGGAWRNKHLGIWFGANSLKRTQRLKKNTVKSEVSKAPRPEMKHHSLSWDSWICTETCWTQTWSRQRRKIITKCHEDTAFHRR